jgi:hypothetical protein
MGQPTKINFKVYQGNTFREVFRWESTKKIYRDIIGITQAAPCVVTATGHGVPNGWQTKITNVGGMVEINSTENYLVATKIDANNLEYNEINSVGFKEYTSGGILEYNEPISLVGYTARMQIRETIDSETIIKELTTENGGIVLDTVDYGIVVTMDALSTANFNFSTAVYSLEMVSSTGVVTTIVTGNLTLIKEVTR